MPNKVIQDLSKQSGIGAEELEKIWKGAAEHGKKKGMKKSNYEAYANAAVHHAVKAKGMDSNRYIDANDCLICPGSVITGAQVANYWGREIPNYKKLGLDPQKIYRVYRPIEEMIDNDFNGKYIFTHHIIDYDAANMDKVRDYIIGTAYDCGQVDKEIHGTVSFTDVKAIDDLDNGKKYLSAGYWYDPVLEAGVFEGQPYDIKMTNIRANHIAHVDNPRYKNAVVGDADTVTTKGNFTMKYKNKALVALMAKLKDKGLDEETVKTLEEEAKAADEEVEETAAPSAAGKAQDNADEDDKKDKGMDDHPDEKEDAKLIEKTLKEKGLDAESINRKIEAGIAAGINAHKAQAKAMDSAFDAFETLYGKANKMAFDSVDAVYDAILSKNNISPKGRTLDAKIGMVEVIIGQQKPQRRQMAADADSGANYKSVFETNGALKRFN